MTDKHIDDAETWSSKDEFIEWIDDYREYVVALGESRASMREISNALKLHKIQQDLESGDITFEEALERYDRVVRMEADN